MQRFPLDTYFQMGRHIYTILGEQLIFVGQRALQFLVTWLLPV